MLEPLRQIFRQKEPRRRKSGPAVPDGERYYVVGDIHGCLDLFMALADAIEKDDRERSAAQTTVVLLGDLVDRGPDSAGVIAFARQWQARREVRILAGNHEQMFLESFEDIDVLRHFLKYGGRETLLSYDLDRKEYNRLSLEELYERLPEIVPEADRAFVEDFEYVIEAGNYLFVHAGINPERPIEKQKRKDLLWIRERFLNHDGPFSHVIVHGHTIFEDVENRGNRIGIDTGAYDTGRLTALVLEGTEQRCIAAVRDDGAITIETEEY